jgi:hypothetical protein
MRYKKKSIKTTKCGKITIIEKKLGREKALGLAYQGEGLIEIDPRQSNKAYLDTLIHEGLHILFPDWSEYKVKKSANKMSEILWKSGYRKVQL